MFNGLRGNLHRRDKIQLALFLNAAQHRRAEVRVQPFQRLGGPLVGARFERILAFDLKEFADLPELSGDEKPILHE